MAFKNLQEFVEHYGLSQDENGRYYLLQFEDYQIEPSIKAKKLRQFFPHLGLERINGRLSKKFLTNELKRELLNLNDCLALLSDLPKAIADIPSLLSEYDSGNPLSAHMVIVGTHRKLKWICSKDHHYQAKGYSRVRGSGCPYCANQQVCADNNLIVTHPHLAKEYDLSNDLPATQVIAGTTRKLKWICSKGHMWADTGANRVRGRGCHVCAKVNNIALLSRYNQNRRKTAVL